jgi:hypothetical protein
MKQYLLTFLVASGLLALIPMESKAQVVISLRPSSSDGYYHQDQPRYIMATPTGITDTTANSVIIAGTATMMIKKSAAEI